MDRHRPWSRGRRRPPLVVIEKDARAEGAAAIRARIRAHGGGNGKSTRSRLRTPGAREATEAVGYTTLGARRRPTLCGVMAGEAGPLRGPSGRRDPGGGRAHRPGHEGTWLPYRGLRA